MKVIPFNREHLHLLDARKYEREHLIPYLTDAYLTAVERIPHCYSLVADGRIVTCIGCIPLWDGVWQVWQIPSVYVKDYVRDYCHTVRGILDNAAELERAWRVQTTAPADRLHDRWMEFLGFECEGVLKEYSRIRQDHKMWARRYSHGS